VIAGRLMLALVVLAFVALALAGVAYGWTVQL
jgi:hypothetical protein